MDKESLFDTPKVISAKIAPDGRLIAYIGGDSKSVPNVFISKNQILGEGEQLTFFEEPDIIQFFWAADGKTLLILKDKNGTGRLGLFGVNVASKKVQEYTKNDPLAQSKIFSVSRKENRAVVGINTRNPSYHDLYLLDLETGERELLLENRGYEKFLIGDDLQIALKMKINADGSSTVFDRHDQVILKLSAEDMFQTEFLECNGDLVYLLDSRHTETNQLGIISLDRSTETVLGHVKESDVDDVLFLDGKPVAFASYYLYKKWHLLDFRVEGDFRLLRENLGEGFTVLNTTNDATKWLLVTRVPNEGCRFWLYDREVKKLSCIFRQGEVLLHKMEPLLAKARDGKELICYCTLPNDVEGPLPLVVVPHGGPFKVRDKYELNPFHQWLANAGYAVLSVNFRLSSGFGKEFVNAGNGQWGKKAHLDVVDAVKCCIDQGIAQEGKIAVLGGSYGGFEALAALTFTPEFFTCGVSICGPSNLSTVLSKVPLYWEFTPSPLADRMMFFTKAAFMTSMGGDPNNPKGAQYLESCSPLNYVEKITKPLLLIHGANDHIVPEAEAIQIFEGLHRQGKEVSFLSFPNEGHRIGRFSNKLQFLDAAEKFLADNLGGKYYPVSEESLLESSGVFMSNSKVSQ